MKTASLPYPTRKGMVWVVNWLNCKGKAPSLNFRRDLILSGSILPSELSISMVKSQRLWPWVGNWIIVIRNSTHIHYLSQYLVVSAIQPVSCIRMPIIYCSLYVDVVYISYVSHAQTLKHYERVQNIDPRDCKPVYWNGRELAPSVQRPRSCDGTAQQFFRIFHDLRMCH
jgi:hypothetical protein